MKTERAIKVIHKKEETKMKFLLSDWDIEKYNITAAELAEGNPFTENLINDLAKISKNEHNFELDPNRARLSIFPYGEHNVIIELEKY
ncbi:MAG: adaptor protein MecA [Lachnospiraceae bacterium]|nr:adaptor protein MecA [Lachnospiraceae bacterium]